MVAPWEKTKKQKRNTKERERIDPEESVGQKGLECKFAKQNIRADGVKQKKTSLIVGWCPARSVGGGEGKCGGAQITEGD